MTVTGAGAAAAQVVGDQNTVTIIVGGARLALDKLHARKAEPQSIIELLRVDVRATTLVGRADELAMLARWRDDPAPIAVKCVTGRAGAGKTRLAIEACEAAEAQDWAAAFVRSDELLRFHQTQNLVHWGLDRDTLIVLDYAAASLPILKTWFELLAPHRRAPAEHRLRILLLERHADPDLGWWADLRRRESLSACAADLIDGEEPYALAALAATEDRRNLLAQAMRLAAPLLDPPAVVRAPPEARADPGFDARLADPRIENEPLYLLMAGVHAARHGVSTALSLDQGKLAFEMAGIELGRIKRFALRRGFNDGGDLLRHLAACVTLQNGCGFDALSALVTEEAREMGLNARLGPEAIAAALCDCMAETTSGLDAVRPDLIGEALVLLEVEASPLRPHEARLGIVRRAHRRDPGGVVQTLIRCARDHADGRADHAAVAWLGELAAASDDIGELLRIADGLPEQTLALSEFAAAISGAHRRVPAASRQTEAGPAANFRRIAQQSRQSPERTWSARGSPRHSARGGGPLPPARSREAGRLHARSRHVAQQHFQSPEQPWSARGSPRQGARGVGPLPCARGREAGRLHAQFRRVAQQSRRSPERAGSA